MLRAASTHFPKLRKLLIELHTAIRSHVHVLEIDQHLCAGNVKSVVEILKLTKFHSLLSTDVESAYVQPINADSSKPVLSRELQLLLTNATVIKADERKLLEDPDCACCSLVTTPFLLERPGIYCLRMRVISENSLDS